jgi:hypothetical protein
MCCACVFSLRWESPDMILGDDSPHFWGGSVTVSSLVRHHKLGIFRSTRVHTHLKQLGFLAPIWAQASSSLCNPRETQALLRQITHTSFLKLCTPWSCWSNTEKVNVGYYAPMIQTTLNPCVFLCVLSLHPQSILHLPTIGFTYPTLNL